MLGVQVAILGVTCLVVIVLLLTSPLWMRGLSAVARALWGQLGKTDAGAGTARQTDEIVEGEFREVDK